jgi:hypothetical protein
MRNKVPSNRSNGVSLSYNETKLAERRLQADLSAKLCEETQRHAVASESHPIKYTLPEAANDGVG